MMLDTYTPNQCPYQVSKITVSKFYPGQDFKCQGHYNQCPTKYQHQTPHSF